MYKIFSVVSGSVISATAGPSELYDVPSSVSRLPVEGDDGYLEMLPGVDGNMTEVQRSVVAGETVEYIEMQRSVVADETGEYIEVRLKFWHLLVCIFIF